MEKDSKNMQEYTYDSTTGYYYDKNGKVIMHDLVQRIPSADSGIDKQTFEVKDCYYEIYKAGLATLTTGLATIMDEDALGTLISVVSDPKIAIDFCKKHSNCYFKQIEIEED